MTDDDISAQVAAILHDWTPHAFGYAKQDGDHWIIGGLYEGAPYWKHTGLRPDGPDTPDDPIAAARWLDAHAKARHQPKEPPHAETIQHEQAGAGDVRDPGGADVAAAEAGVRAADGGGGDSGGVDGAAELEDAVSAQAAEYVAAEVDDKPPADPALDAEVTEAPGATYGGTMVERDDAARLVRQLTIDITYSRIDRVENLKIRRGLLAGQHQRLWALGDLTKDMDIATVNTLDKQIRATDDLIAEIERFGKSMVDSLAGKTLDELKAIDVAAAPWPT